MCFCTFENVKKFDFVLLKMDFFGNFNSLCAVSSASDGEDLAQVKCKDLHRKSVKG